MDATGRACPITLPNATPPIVVVGAGPVGVHVVQTLRRRDPLLPIVLYGREPTPPYNRIQLSPLLAGEASWAGVADSPALAADDTHTAVRLGTSVLQIDRDARCIYDSAQRRQPYADLVLATGSRPRVPDIPGVGQNHVYVFRSLADTERLMARRVRSRRTVVLGGGLLGLEAARAMQRMHTEVVVIEHGPHLMAAQLGEAGARLLQAHAERLGLQVRTGERVKAINGHGSVSGVTLRDGTTIACDTVVIAAGIEPEIRLAINAGLPVGRGVRVDDRMATEDPHIFAVGECAEHRGRVYGLLAPGLEQAAVAVNSLLGGQARYEGSLAAARLKVLGLPVFSLGEVHADGPDLEALEYADAEAGVQRRLVLSRGRVVGLQTVGPCDAVGRLQTMVLARQRLMPWQRWRWLRHGLPWSGDGEAPVADWPDDAVVCNCNAVRCGTLRTAMAEGCGSVEALAARTRASTVCGSCRPLLGELVASAGGSASRARPAPALATLAVLAAVAAALTLAVPGLAYDGSVQLAHRLDSLWRDGLLKQVSGFTLLGLSALAVALGLRKRVRGFTLGGFDGWRLVHSAIGLLALLALWAHTGARAGHALNLSLAALFAGLIVVGGLGAAVIAFEDRLPPRWVRRWRQRAVWLHIGLFWPVPALLGVHVFKTYWY